MAANTKTRPASSKANSRFTAPSPKKAPVVKKSASKPAVSSSKKAPVVKAAAKPVVKTVSKAPARPTAKQVSKAPAKSAGKPVVKPTSKAPAKPAAKPAVKAPAKPAAKSTAKPSAKPAVKVPAKAAAKPASKAPAKPAVKSAAKPAVKAPSKAVAKPVAKAPAKPAVKPAAKPVAKAPEGSAKPAAKPVPAKPAPAAAPAKQTSKPVELPRPNPVMTQAAMEAERRKLAKMKESQKKAPPVVSPKIKTTSSRKYQPEFLKSVLDQPAHSEQTGPMIRYSDADLQEFKELITKKLEDSKRELAYWQGIITHKGEMSGDESDARYGGMEEGVSSEREYASAMASRTLDFIEKLEKALMRIQNKTYGICRVTGKLIDKARLRAVPHATLSMEAKMAMSRNPGGGQQNP